MGEGYQGSKPYLLDVQKHVVDFDFQPGTDLAERDRERERTRAHVSHTEQPVRQLGGDLQSQPPLPPLQQGPHRPPPPLPSPSAQGERVAPAAISLLQPPLVWPRHGLASPLVGNG